MTYAQALKLFAQDTLRRRYDDLVREMGRTYGAWATVGRELQMTAFNARLIAEGRHKSISRETEQRLAEMLFNGDEEKLREAVVAFGKKREPVPYDEVLMAAVGVLAVRDSGNAGVYAEAARSLSFSDGVRYPTVDAAVEGLEEIVRAGTRPQRGPKK